MDDPGVAALLEHVLGERVTPGTLDIRRPGGGGWSNDTVLVGLGGGRRVVVRRQPASASMFPRYDLRREYECLGALNSAGRAPVPALIGEDLAGETTGRPAFVMAYVDGRVPADDRPTFAEAGWLHDACPAEQRRFHEGLLTSVAAVNATPADDSVVALLRRPGTETCTALIEDLAAIWAFDQGDVASPIIDETFDRVRDSIPKPSPDVLLWGDARPANVIVDNNGFDPVALVDFELAAWGPAELDVTWLAEMDRMRTVGSRIAPLPGFFDDDSAIDHYERCAHQRLNSAMLEWAVRFNALKIAVLMHRHLRVTVHEGRLPAGHRIFSDNVSLRRCRELTP